MIYIVVALKSEAQAFIERFKLKKSKLQNFTIYFNNNMQLIISGVGVRNSQKATALLVGVMRSDEALYNVGICASKYPLGEVLEISKVRYDAYEICLNTNTTNTINTLDVEATDDDFDIVDMESFGFAKSSFGVENRYIYKVVSDNFEPQKVSKDATKKLVYKLIDEVFCEISSS